MNQNFIANIISKIRGQYKCPSCSSQYNLSDLVVTNQASNQLIIRLNCHNCQMPVNVSVMTSQPKDSSTVSHQPVNKFAFGEESVVGHQLAINPREILDFKNFLDSQV